MISHRHQNTQNNVIYKRYDSIHRNEPKWMEVFFLLNKNVSFQTLFTYPNKFYLIPCKHQPSYNTSGSSVSRGIYFQRDFSKLEHCSPKHTKLTFNFLLSRLNVFISFLYYKSVFFYYIAILNGNFFHKHLNRSCTHSKSFPFRTVTYNWYCLTTRTPL